MPKNLAETLSAQCRTVNFQLAYRNVGMARFPVTENLVYQALASPHVDTSHRARIHDIYSMTTSVANTAGQAGSKSNC